MLANIILDLILVSILVLGTVIGAKRGFIGTIAKPVKVALSFGLSAICCKGVGLKIVQPIISPAITTKLSSLLLDKYSEISASTSADLPTIIKLAAGMAGIDLTSISSEGDGYIYALIDMITEPVIRIASVVIAFLALIIIFSIVVSLLLWLIDKLVQKGLLGVVNKVIGATLCFCFAFVLAWCLASSTDFIFSLPSIRESEWIREFTGGFVYRFFKSMSPIELLLSF